MASTLERLPGGGDIRAEPCRMSCSERGSSMGKQDAKAQRSVIRWPMWRLMDKFRQDKDSEFFNFEVNPVFTFLILIFQYLHAHDWILSQMPVWF